MVGQQQQHHNSNSSCQPTSTSSMPGNTKSSSPSNNNIPGNRCVWCRKCQVKLNFVLPTAEGKKEFCTCDCLLHFRNVYNDKQNPCVLCPNCDCLVRTPSTEPQVKLQVQGKTLEFCCAGCLDEYKQKHNIGVQKASPHVAAKKKQDNSFQNGEFKWQEYLSRTNGTPAPSSCFKQHSTPPSNEFTKDMKLEAVDPRNTTSMCIATVIASIGPRMRLRLDGSDNSNDFWRMVDSNEIQPVGTCQDKQVLLQPPLGFIMNASSWPKFLLKTLHGATMAPKEFFKPEPPTPRFNLFKIGHKLEAVDRKNPHLICVATVGGVDRDNIHVTFDGWRGAFDYWCKYDSRDIFPVGWCDNCNHPLQPPGNKLPLVSTPSPPAAAPQISSSCSASSESAPSQDSSTSTPVPPYTVTLHLHAYCDCGPYLDKIKLRSSPTIIGPSNIQEVYNQFVQILKQSAVSKQQVEKLLLVQGSEILEQGDFWSEILNIIDRFKLCVNLVNDKPIEEEEEGGRPTRASGKSKECSKCGGGRNGEVGLRPGVKRKIAKVKREEPEPPVKIEQPANPPPPKKPAPAKIVGDPKDWDVEQVIVNITGVDKSMNAYADLFRTHQIDGRAMLLLNSEVMMRYMGLKLGPALKIINIISKYKTKSSSKNGGSSNGIS
ncbi:Polycomb protein Scm [Orchesella cincta]|uniref:Polycomb protein Scm n=1 Tax=Orchesella cincta TaxID=48709 RepID=A0A1D2MNH3_ORCCI|nr:Polycomb protein Scm [Orchesella cincta]